MQIPLSQIPKGETEATLRAKLAAYRAALDAHASTVGVPKPLPPYEFFIDIEARGRGETLDVLPDQIETLPDDKAALRLAALDALLKDYAARFAASPKAIKDFAALP